MTALLLGSPALADERVSAASENGARAEELPARPPLPDVRLEGRLPWQRHGDIGVGLAWISRPFADALGATGTRYEPTLGVQVHLQWDLARWVHLRPYLLWGAHPVDVRSGALSTTSPRSIATNAALDAIRATTFAFGLKLAPQWPLTSRLRTWVVAGMGYGRLGVTGAGGSEPDGASFTLPNRTGVFVEFPLGVGASFEVWPGRAALTFETTGAPIVGHSGSAHENATFVDASGKQRETGPFGAFEASFVQSIGLSLLL